MFGREQEMAQSPALQDYAHWLAQYIPMLDSIRGVRGGGASFIQIYSALFWTIAPIFTVTAWYQRRRMCLDFKENAREFSDWKLSWGTVFC